MRLFALILSAALLAGCMSPCQRLSRDMDKLNADLIRNPSIATSGDYVARLQELAAQAVEHRCF
jgi:hypothetical protein